MHSSLRRGEGEGVGLYNCHSYAIDNQKHHSSRAENITYYYYKLPPPVSSKMDTKSIIECITKASCTLEERNLCDMLAEKQEQATVGDLICHGWGDATIEKFQKAIIKKSIDEGVFAIPLELLEEDFFAKTITLSKDEEMIVDYMWNKYNIKAHFDQTKTHKEYVSNMWQRLRQVIRFLGLKALLDEDFELTDEYLELVDLLIKIHDSTKYKLRYVFGYTRRFVHDKRFTDIGEAAIKGHLCEEPHHTNFWEVVNFSTDLEMVKRWVDGLFLISDSIKMRLLHLFDNTGVLSSSPPSTASTPIPSPFLFEVVCDQLSRDWEKKRPQLKIQGKEGVPAAKLFNINYHIPSNARVNSKLSRLTSLLQCLPEMLLE